MTGEGWIGKIEGLKDRLSEKGQREKSKGKKPDTYLL
jgi:hypothetical protein